MRNIGKWHLVNGQQYFVKRVKPENFFVKYNGYGIDMRTVIREMDDCDLVILAEQGDDVAYSTDRATILEHGVEVNYNGMGRQYILPLKHWKPFDIKLFRKIYRS